MRFIKKHFKIILILLAVMALCGGGALYYLKTSNSEMAVKFRRFAGDTLHTWRFPSRPSPDTGLESVRRETLFVNNVPADSVKQGKDNKRVLETDAITRLFDYTTGYYVDLPQETAFDFTKSPAFTTIEGEGFKGVISREWSVEGDVSAYVNYYFNRFILNEGFLKENRIQIVENVKEGSIEKITLWVEELEDQYDTYTYLIFKTDSRFFFRVLLKYKKNNAEMDEIIQGITDSFYYFKPMGKAVYTVDWQPSISDSWSAETTALYERFLNPDTFLWGIFVQNMTEKGLQETIPAMEAELDYQFDIVLAYAHLTESFPTALLEECYAEGRLVELTYQLTTCNNENLYARSPLLEMYRGAEYEAIREFARQAKAFGHPFLFRLNNEMNSDWTSYGGVNNLIDPDIFVDNWQTIYLIFEEEGVDNAIWVFNPNDRDCPPNNWNSFAAYYPGNDYVHMLGVTGYNNGTYYSQVTGESWREFELIYDTIASQYGDVFGRFPWIITEFASSSHGGDKVKWIDNMFRVLTKYPQIRAAVWFSFADYDFRPEYAGQVARPYWLDETPETLAAFKRGLHKVN